MTESDRRSDLQALDFLNVENAKRNLERPFYEDPELKIANSPYSFQDHTLYFIQSGQEEGRYIIPRGCLEEFATTPRDRLELKLITMNETLVLHAIQRGLTIDSLGMAFAQAYIEQERRYKSTQVR